MTPGSLSLKSTTELPEKPRQSGFPEMDDLQQVFMESGVRSRDAGGFLVETTEIKTHTRDVLVGAHLRWSF